MKNDSSRNTFDARRHFSGVRMQQGRVQLDADWNEQSDIVTHRVDTGASDLIGPCGGPLHDAAFHVVADINQLTAEEKNRPGNQTPPPNFAAPDFLIGAGRYYVDGILCENDLLTSYANQPDLPDAPPVEAVGLYLVYVDVWQRHLTALDEPAIREIALGGPDTATRTKTVWQVKHWFAGEAAEGNCLTKFEDYEKLIAPSDGKLSARAQKEQASTDPCIVPPGAGYRGLENQHYRVEIHQGGAAHDVTGGGAGTLATRVQNSSDQVKVTGGSWHQGQAVEIFSSEAGSDPLNGTLAHVLNFDNGSKTLTLNVNVSKIALDELRLREVKASYKWSRDNGVVVTTIKSIDGPEITVHDLGPDAVLGFQVGDWVELLDDVLELNGQPGQLSQIIKIDQAINLITLNFTPAPLSAQPGVDRHPKLRRWDGAGAVKFHPNVAGDHFLNLESGVQVRFSAGTYKTGDYWNIPARTATADTQSGNIDWPQVSNAPLALPPSGIRHHYCRLAMLHWDGTTFDVVEDCRHLFPPVTELTSLFYVGGDGQEAMPNDPIPQLLQVGVFNGRWPVAGARVKFVAQGAGRLAADIAGLVSSNTNTLTIATGTDGVAGCAWRLEADVTKTSQQVEARLLDANEAELPPLVRFNANHSIADQVFYDPGACATLQEQQTVQKALRRLSELASLYKLSGDGQEVVPGEALAPLRVLVASRCGPITDRTVTFQIVPPGTGSVSASAGGPDANSVDVTTGASGVATCFWEPDPATPFQEVEATLKGDAAHPTVPPTSVRFNATRSLASHVAYTPLPDDCPNLAGATTVQEALDKLCSLKSGEGGCDVVVGEGGQFARLDEAIRALLERGQTDICICLLPGEHNLPEGLNIERDGKDTRIKIEGCGRGSRIHILPDTTRGASRVSGLISFKLRGVELFSETSVEFGDCDDVAFEGCHLAQENQERPFIRIAGARRIRFADNVVSATFPLTRSSETPTRIFDQIAPSVAEQFKLRSANEFNARSSQVSSELAARSITERRTLATQLGRAVEEFENLPAAQLQSFREFIRALGAQQADARLLRAGLAKIREAALSGALGVALVLTDAAAETWIEDNHINGVVSLYGDPGESGLTEEELRLIANAFTEGNLRFGDSRSHLHVRDNILYRVVVSEQIIALLKTINPDNGASLDLLYRRSFVHGNVFHGGNNVFVVEHLSLTSNSFELEGELDAGTVLANAAIHVGNFAPNDIRLFNLALGKEKVANLFIDIVDL